MMSSDFFTDVILHEKIDAFVKFYNICTLKHVYNDCVLGCFAMRALHLQMYPHYLKDFQPSAEIAFATYVRHCGATLKEIDHLGIECEIADSYQIIIC